MKFGISMLIAVVLMAVAPLDAQGLSTSMDARALDDASEFADSLTFSEALGSGAQAEEGLDWRFGVAVASGLGVPPPFAVTGQQARGMAIRAAEVAARKNLQAMIASIFIDASTTVGQAMSSNDVLRERVLGLLQNSRIVETSLRDDNSAMVVVGLDLHGEFADIFLPRVMGAASGGVAPHGGYTGLIVDARGLQAKPALVLRILDEGGRELYGPTSAERQAAVEHGMAVYHLGMEAARLDARAGGRPLQVRAVRAVGTNRTDLILSDPEVALLREGLGGSKALSRCRVVIVFD
ncbi:Putattive Lipoprotein LPP20 [Alkalidesulfovibrio alkalitolerans DSM 16529]|uniref:Putattive Lipoprotein LPP20 n=1 Tax=Alkalidesulfovibrio alkalitolerans DSM 16529 TaxID=1121439 RepID=S7T521_9BACT|nr:hypothetical protein [Alkalidesulfovibrio alkalitolerans]EPR31600.1 Putattive Lipoprotein LPP20 [Alkalidesulfovibrio alkalitolerans DSM 16529]